MSGSVRWVACVLSLAIVSVTSHAQSIKYAVGQDIVPAFEGWQRNPDGTIRMHFGYLNRNYEQELDVPVGPNNKFDPAPLDRNQPTHFYTRRQKFVFTVTVPKDWDKTKRLVWSITANGKTETANGWLQPEWEVDDGVIQMNIGPGGAPPDPPNHAPRVTDGSKDLNGAVHTPITLQVAAVDDAIPKPRKPRPGATTPPPPTGVRVRWLHYRGAGAVRFDPDHSEPVYDKPIDESTRATFSAPGKYVVRAVVSDGLLETPYDIAVNVQ